MACFNDLPLDVVRKIMGHMFSAFDVEGLVALAKTARAQRRTWNETQQQLGEAMVRNTLKYYNFLVAVKETASAFDAAYYAQEQRVYNNSAWNFCIESSCGLHISVSHYNFSTCRMEPRYIIGFNTNIATPAHVPPHHFWTLGHEGKSRSFGTLGDLITFFDLPMMQQLQFEYRYHQNGTIGRPETFDPLETVIITDLADYCGRMLAGPFTLGASATLRFPCGRSGCRIPLDGLFRIKKSIKVGYYATSAPRAPLKSGLRIFKVGKPVKAVKAVKAVA